MELRIRVNWERRVDKLAKKTAWRPWVRGFLQTVVSSVVGGVSVVLVDPHTFSDWDKLVKITGVFALVGVLNYLSKSPLPEEVEIED